MAVFVSVVLFCGGWGSLSCCSVLVSVVFVSAALCCEVLCCGSVCKCSVVLWRVGLALLLFCVGQCSVCQCGAVL